MADFLDGTEKDIANRINELKPAVLEYEQLVAAAQALGMDLTNGRGRPGRPSGKRGPGRPARKRGPGRPPGKPGRKPAVPKAARGKASGRRAGRRKGSGTRAAEALKFVTESPGITIPELAAKMGIKQNYLYRVLPGLATEKKIKRDEAGKGWHPTKKATAAA
jgi:hypothetical protein